MFIKRSSQHQSMQKCPCTTNFCTRRGVNDRNTMRRSIMALQVLSAVLLALHMNNMNILPVVQSFSLPAATTPLSMYTRTQQCSHHHHPQTSFSSSTSLYAKKGWTTSLFPVTVVMPPTTTPLLDQQPKIVKQQVILPPDQGFISAAMVQTYAGCIGALTGFFIAGFKLSIENIREFAYATALSDFEPSFQVEYLLIFIPVLGGAAVGLLAFLGSIANNNNNSIGFPPGVRGIVDEADKDSLDTNEKSTLVELAESFRKASAAVFTLGTGCSLGPEGPGVEIGIAASRLLVGTLTWPQQLFETTAPLLDMPSNERLNNAAARVRRNRLFLACGAAAGVSSGFNAPLAGVFFAIEVIQRNLPPIDIPVVASSSPSSSSLDGTDTTVVYELQQESLSNDAASITAILTSSVVSALVIRLLLGNELALRLLEYEIPTPLRELPIYLLLGATSGIAAVVFSQTTKLAKAGFDGEIGPQPLRHVVDGIPDAVKPIIGGLTCGTIGFIYPNILFFGYETLNSLLLNNSIETSVAVSLLVAKICATAVSAASGLVGGTLAPSLFMGGMVGVSFHNVIVNVLDVSSLDFATPIFGSAFQLADLPAYTMVGAASFLAAIFRAPLFASLLAFELTKNYDVLVPLLASAGVGTLLCDLVERRIVQQQPASK